MRIGILYDDVDDRREADSDTQGARETVEAVSLALRDLGHLPVRIPVAGAPDLWAGQLADASIELVFNLCGGTGGTSDVETKVAALVELLGLPMTGSGSETLALARRKDRVKAILQAADLAVPSWTAVQRGEPVKLPPGRILQLGIVGERVLPLAEIGFDTLPDGSRPVVGKGITQEAGLAGGPVLRLTCPAPLDAPTRDRAIELGLTTWRAVEGRGYGHVDLWTDGRGRLYVLDVTPNPDLSPAGGLTRMATADGWGYADLIGHIVEEALRPPGLSRGS